jgi:hypothetical protein
MGSVYRTLTDCYGFSHISDLTVTLYLFMHAFTWPQLISRDFKYIVLSWSSAPPDPPISRPLISRTDRRSHGRADSRTDGRSDGRTDGRSDGRTVGWMDSQPDRQTEGRSDRRTPERQSEGRTDGRTN